jgi:glycosyltransferase involved in cell wall biosynthesis
MEWLPDQPGAGGLPRYFHGLVEALPSAGVEGTALVSRGSRRSAIGHTFAVEPMSENGSSLLRTMKRARDLGQAEWERGIDLVNAHFALYAHRLVRAMPRTMPLVVHFHGPWAEETAAEHGPLIGRARYAVAKRIELGVYHRADRIITLSQAFAQILRERYGISEDRIRVVPGGVDLTRYLAAPAREEARRRLGWPTDRPIVLTVRRLVRRMGLELLVEAAARIQCDCPDVLVLIGGKGPLHQELQQRIDCAELQDHVRLLGLIPENDLPLAYAAADLSVVPTVKLEGFGLVTVESLASGTAVLGTPIGGTPEILRGLDVNLVLDGATADAIAQRASAVLRGALVIKSCQECRAYAARYDWAQVAPHIRRVFQDAIAVHGAGTVQHRKGSSPLGAATPGVERDVLQVPRELNGL